jgi:hypothetical protein
MGRPPSNDEEHRNSQKTHGMEARGQKMCWAAETSMDGVEEDLRKVKVKKWWLAARNRESWRNILREAKTHSGL